MSRPGYGFGTRLATGIGLFALLWLQVASGPGVARAQSISPLPTTAGTPDEPLPTSAKRIQMSALDTYYLPDKNGQLIPVFRIPFEEFERLLQQQRATESPTVPVSSGFRVVQANFLGEADPAVSRVNMRVRLQVLLSQEGWQQIPLGMNGWVLQGLVGGPASAQHYLTRGDNGGLVLHASGPIGEILEFELPLSASIRRIGNIHQLPISFPHPTETTFRLELAATSLEVSAGNVTDLQTTESDGRTVVQIRELSEQSVVSWQAAAATTVSFPLKARIDSLLRVQSIGGGNWQVNTLLNLTPLNQAVADLTLAIPANAENFSTQQSNVRIQRISEGEARQLASQVPPGAQYVRLLFDKGVTEATQLQLTYTVLGQDAPELDESRVELGGPQVLDCLFTSSSLELVKDREVATQWQLGPGVSLRTNAQEKSDSTAFNLERQDFRLTLINRPQAIQVRVASEYTLIVTQQIVMTARFRCQIQGKFNAPLRLQLGSWQYLSGDSSIQAQEGRLLIDPAAQVVGPDGDLEFDCTLQMQTPDHFDLILPQIEGEVALVQQPAQVVLVLSDPSQEFQFDATNSSVVRDAASPVQFRARDANAPVVLRGQLGLRPRTVLMQQTTQLFPKSQEASSTENWYPVRHELMVEVSNQPLPGLSLLLSNVAPIKQLQVRLGNEVLPLKTTIVRVAGREFHAIEFPLSSERLLGNLRLEVTHLLSETTLPDDRQPSRIVVPSLQVAVEPLTRLVPIDDDDSLHRFLAAQIAGWQIRQRNLQTPRLADQEDRVSTNEWGNLISTEVGDSWRNWFVNGPWPLHFVIERRQLEPRVAEVAIDAIHVRTWWSGDHRREQMTTSLASQERKLTVAIPAELDVRQVLVQGQTTTFERNSEENTITFEIANEDQTTSSVEAAETKAARYRIDIWYARTQPSGIWTPLTLQLPNFPNQQWCRDFTWEIMSSDVWQILWASNELTWLPTATPTLANGDEQVEANAGAAITVYQSDHEPSHYGLIMVHRRWFRLAAILIGCGVVLASWALGWHRQSAFWLSLAGGLVLIAWQWPHLGWETAPWAVLTLMASMLVLWIEFATRRVERGVATEMTSDATRSYWNEAAGEQERSNPSLSRRSSVSVGEPT
ncbi:MAG: hypothetical protein JNL67_15520 [Planctomycetaceae bacterium]|nr:hypothetical protein [Planctomycetaceae bacterium]